MSNGNQALAGVLLAIDGEGDAHAAKQQLRLGAPRGEMFGGRRLKPSRDLAVDGANVAARQCHFVETAPVSQYRKLLSKTNPDPTAPAKPSILHTSKKPESLRRRLPN